MLAGWFARRYFFSKKSHSVINLIAGVSVVSVAVPVAAMIVLLSVFNGFEQLVRSMNSHFDADLTLTPREGQTFGIESLDTAALRRLPGVEAVSLALEQSALMEYRGRQAMVTVRGVADGYDRVVPVAECITAGDYAVRLGDLDRLVVGRGVAYELGLRSLGESDGVLYALRRTGFSSLLPVEGYTRRQAEVAGGFELVSEPTGWIHTRNCNYRRTSSLCRNQYPPYGYRRHPRSDGRGLLPIPCARNRKGMIRAIAPCRGRGRWSARPTAGCPVRRKVLLPT